MKITTVSTRVVNAGDREWVFVRVDTDEPGLVGWGEASLSWHTRGVCGTVEDLAPLLVWQDPRAVEHLWQLMYRGRYFKAGIVTMSAIAGIDQALWDIKAKALGVPLFELLGGPVRERVRLYQNLGSELGGDTRSPQAWAEAAHASRAAGYDAVKVYPVQAGPGLEGGAALRETVRLVQAVREAAGEDTDIMVDFHGRTTPAMAIQYGHALAPLRPWFLEEPCQPENVDGMVEVARALPIAIATGERLASRYEFREYLERRACAVVQPDVCYCGGITELRRIAALAETYLVSVAPHNPNGPIATMVSIHLALAMPNFLILEQVRDDVPWRWEVVDASPHTIGGYTGPPTRPGIGVDVVEAVAAAHPGDGRRPHLRFAPDGALADW
jgi:galactonate dehydratase